MKKAVLIIIGMVGILLFLSVRLLNISLIDKDNTQIDYTSLTDDQLRIKSYEALQQRDNRKAYFYAKHLVERVPDEYNAYLSMAAAYGNEDLPLKALEYLQKAEQILTTDDDLHDYFELLYLKAFAYHNSYILENNKYLNESIESHQQAIDFFNENGVEWDAQEKVSLINSLLDVLIQAERYPEAEVVLKELEDVSSDYVVAEYYRMLINHYKHDDDVVIKASKNLILYGEKNNNKTFWWAGNLYFDYTSKKDLSNLEERLKDYLNGTNDDLVLSIHCRLSNSLKDPIKDTDAIHNNIKSILDVDIEQLYESEMKPQYALYDFDITEYEEKMEAHRNELYSFTFENN